MQIPSQNSSLLGAPVKKKKSRDPIGFSAVRNLNPYFDEEVDNRICWAPRKKPRERGERKMPYPIILFPIDPDNPWSF